MGRSVEARASVRVAAVSVMMDGLASTASSPAPAT